MDDDYLVPLMQDHGFLMRSQDLPAAYVVNGCFYLITPEELRDKRSFIVDKIIPLLIESPQEALDIDTEWDFFIAECFFSRKNIIV